MRTDNLHIRGLKFLLALAGSTLGGAITLATIAGAFGMLVGVVFGLLHSDVHNVLPMAGYFALCGAASGSLLGAFYRILDPEGLADPLPRSAASAANRHGGSQPRAPRIKPGILRRLIGRSESQRIPRQNDPSLN